MKKPLATTAIGAAVLFALTGCIQSMPAGGSHSTQQATTEAPKAEVPNLVGMDATSAIQAVVAAGLATNLVGTDAATVSTLPSAAGAKVKVVKTDPAAGEKVEAGSSITIVLNTTEKAQVAAKAQAELDTRYSIRCGNGTFLDSTTAYNSPQKVWKSEDYKGSHECSVEIAGEDSLSGSDSITLNASEKVLVAKVGKAGGDISVPASTVGDIIELCSVAPPSGWDWSKGKAEYTRALAQAAANYCPSAPHVAELKRVASGILPAEIEDGKNVAGKQFQPGTYQLQIAPGGKVSDCYWAVSEPQGGIIANDFVTLASEGLMVTIGDGQGFTSERCGTWKKTG